MKTDINLICQLYL